MTYFEDYYEIIRVNPLAKPEDIEEAYKKLSNKYDPIRNNDPAAVEAMRIIDTAYSVLKDPVLRDRYHQEWLEKTLYKPEYIPKDKTIDTPKYKAEYIPKNEAYNSPKYKAEYIPKDKAYNDPEFQAEPVSIRNINSRRILIVILLVVDLSLASIFILMPLINSFLTQNIWILYVVSLLFCAIVASLIFSVKFRQGFNYSIKSAFKSVKNWITSMPGNNHFLDRFLIFVLTFILIVLIVYIYVLPWIIQIFIRRSPVEVVLLFGSLLIIGILLVSPRFWRFCSTIIQSMRSIIVHFIPNNLNATEFTSTISEWTWEPANMKDVFSRNVWNEITRFEPSRQYSKEQGYHNELYFYLKAKFIQSKFNKRRGSSQPDILIEHIAIEVKGPTSKRGCDDCMNKAIRYTADGHYSLFFIVLFNPQQEISSAYFKDFKDGLLKSHPEVGVITKWK